MFLYLAAFAKALWITWVILSITKLIFQKYLPSQKSPELFGVIISISFIALISFIRNGSSFFSELDLWIVGAPVGVALAYIFAHIEARMRKGPYFKHPVKSPPSGASGWLYLLIFGFLYYLPSYWLLRMANLSFEILQDVSGQYDERTKTILLNAEWLFTAISITACIFAAIKLRSYHRWSSVQLAIIVSFLIGPAVSYGRLYVRETVLQLQIIDPAFQSSVVTSLFMAIIIMIYLRRSKRSNNTYIRDPYVYPE